MSVTHTEPTRSPIEGVTAWRPDALSDGDWSWTFGRREADEIVEAATAAAGRGVRPQAVTIDDFPLPSIAARVTEWSAALRCGLGFLLLRGFPIERMTAEETELAYVGFGLHLGTPVGQNQAGDTLTHIIDERLEESGPTVRLYRTNKRQDFHTDGADLVGLLCLHRARSGGESRIASGATVYNEVLRRRPDLLEVLYRPMCWDMNGQEAPGAAPYFELAPCFEVDGAPRFFYIGWYIRDAQRHPQVPRLTDDQLAAMALVEEIANDPSIHVEMDFQPGDIQLLNNARILHAREAYEDDADAAQRRHLLRLWLAAHQFASVEGGLRAGINTRR